MTLVIREEGGDLVREVDVSSTPYTDSGIIDETFAVSFKGNKIYSVQLQIEIYSRKLATNKYYFSTLCIYTLYNYSVLFQYVNTQNSTMHRITISQLVKIDFISPIT